MDILGNYFFYQWLHANWNMKFIEETDSYNIKTPIRIFKISYIIFQTFPEPIQLDRKYLLVFYRRLLQASIE